MMIYGADWEATNGHPRLGRQLGVLLAEAGLVDVTASASYEVFNDLESRRFIGQIATGRLGEADFVERVVQHKLASRAELEAIKDAWLAWQELSGAFVAIAHGEAVGCKA